MTERGASRRRSRRLASNKPNPELPQDMAVGGDQPRSASTASAGLELIPVSRSASPSSQKRISSSHEIVLRDSCNRTMVVHNRSTRQMTVYKAPTPSKAEDCSRDLCPFCLRPLYDYNPNSPAADNVHFASNLIHAHDYFFRLGQMHLLEREEQEPSDLHNQSDHLSESSFNSGYYTRFFKENRKLGSGGYGSVYLCSHLLDGMTLGTYACKKIPVGDNRPWLNRVLSEVRAVESVRHPNVVAYKHSWLEITQTADFGPKVPVMFMLMEYANMGNLADYVTDLKSKQQLLTEPEIWSLFRGIAQGLSHLHHSGIIHRDMKPENLLLNADYDVVSESSSLRIMISDFGESETLKAATRRPRTGNTGTLFFCAPELLLEDSDYGDRADIYSLGIVLYFLAFGQGPYDSVSASIDSPERLNELLKSQSLKMSFPPSAGRGKDLTDLITHMTAFDSKDRPSIDEVLRHPFLNAPASAPNFFKEALNIPKKNIATTLMIGSQSDSQHNLVNVQRIPAVLSPPMIHALALVLHQITMQAQQPNHIQIPLVTLLGCATILLSSSRPISSTQRALQCLLVLLESAVSSYPGRSMHGVLASTALCALQTVSILWRNKRRKL